MKTIEDLADDLKARRPITIDEIDAVALTSVMLVLRDGSTSPIDALLEECFSFSRIERW